MLKALWIMTVIYMSFTDYIQTLKMIDILYLVFYLSFIYLETGLSHVALASPELEVLLFQPAEWSDYWSVPPLLAFVFGC